MRVRVRLGAGLTGASSRTFLDVGLDDGATVADLYARLAESEPDVAAALPSTLAVVGGEQVRRDRVLEDRQEVALLLPISGG